MYEIVRIFADVIRVATFQPAPEPRRDRFEPRSLMQPWRIKVVSVPRIKSRPLS